MDWRGREQTAAVPSRFREVFRTEDRGRGPTVPPKPGLPRAASGGSLDLPDPAIPDPRDPSGAAIREERRVLGPSSAEFGWSLHCIDLIGRATMRFSCPDRLATIAWGEARLRLAEPIAGGLEPSQGSEDNRWSPFPEDVSRRDIVRAGT